MGFLSAKSAVGLDIDTAEIRAVELNGSALSPNLVKHGRVPLPGGAVMDGMIVNPGMVEDALAQLWSEAGLSREVILGVSNQGVLVRFATFPKVADNKMDKLIRFQAQEHIPFPLDSVVLDYVVVGEAHADGSTFLEVLLVAGKRDMINIFIEAASGANLKVRDIDVSSLALQRIIPSSEQRGAAAVINIANEQSHILVIENDKPHFARVISTGLQAAAGFFNCSLNEVVPINKGVQPIWSEDAVASWSAVLSGEINSSLSYYRTQQKGVEIERVYLTGRGARMDGLSGKLQENLGIPVTVVHPLDRVAGYNQKNTGISGVAQDYTVSVALALRGLEA